MPEFSDPPSILAGIHLFGKAGRFLRQPRDVPAISTLGPAHNVRQNSNRECRIARWSASNSLGIAQQLARCLMLQLFLMLVLSAQSQSAPPLVREPDIFGDKVVFTCEGDLWLGDITTGQAVRLTRHEGREYGARFSPDGRTIAFTGEYDGTRQVYVIPTEGGVPQRVTYNTEYALAMDWYPDGKRIAYATRGCPASYLVYSVPLQGGFAERLPLEFVAAVSIAPDGNRFAFTRIPRAGSAWFRYEGGQVNPIWVGDVAKQEFKKIFESKGSNEYPVWMEDRVCFVNDDKAGFSVLAIDPRGGKPRRVAGPYQVEVRELQGDGKRLIYEKGLGLEMADLATGEIRAVTFDLRSDLRHTLPYLAPAERHVFSAHLGPTGKRLLVETRGQIISVPAEKGAVRTVLAKDGVRYRLPAYSPDAKRIAYVSDETREQQLYVADADGSNPKALTSDSGRQLCFVQWSPDGKWIALTDNLTRLKLINVETGEEKEIAKGMGWEGPRCDFSPDSKWIVYTEYDLITYFQAVALYEIGTGERHILGNWMAHDCAPVFSSDRKWIAFLSRRSFNPQWDEIQNHTHTVDMNKPYLLALRNDTASPFLCENEEESAPKEEEPKEKDKDKEEKQEFRIDLEGLYDRLIEIPVAPHNYEQIAVIGDRVLLSHNAPGGKTVTYYDLKEKKGGPISSFQVSADNKKLLLYNGAHMQVVDVTAKDAGYSKGTVSFANYQLSIDPLPEWENMYWDAWRLIRDYFYVANMHGNDWPAVGEKYAKLLPSVRSRDELNELIRWVLSELSVSHTWVYGGDARNVAVGASPSFLGADLEPDESGFYKIAKIFRGDGYSSSDCSPLAAPGLNVKEGDYLIEVAGVPARVEEDFQSALIGRAGQIVSVKVNDEPKAEGARTCYVKPVSSEYRMRYLEWVKERRDYTAKHSDGRIGYVHIPNMGRQGLAEFLKQYFPQRNKEALVVDIRFNGGGNVSDHIISVLKQRAVSFFNSRNNRQPSTRQGEYFPGPMACLINEFSGSNAEEFPYHFKKIGLGPLVGRRTWGGEVGSDPGWRLADGGVVAVPNYGAWTPEEGWIIEGHGVDPDQDVESDPRAWVRGVDPQLDKAIELLLAELKRHPVKRPTQPPDPVKVRTR
jgi:tricorn protease